MSHKRGPSVSPTRRYDQKRARFHANSTDDIPRHRSHQIYDELASSAREFRILTLQPGQSNDPIICSLSKASLTDSPCPAYETISYHWGRLSSNHEADKTFPARPLDESRVEILGRQMVVPTRAEQALRCMRLPDKPRTVWVDSICINQADVLEQEQQIAVMGDIYRNGTRNLVHLGAQDEDEAESSVSALRLAYQRLQAELEKLPAEAQRQWCESRIKPDGWGKLEDPPVLLDDAWPVKRMFSCDWFTYVLLAPLD